MKIVIAGAGDVGFHLATLLELEHHAITLIDQDQGVLQYTANHLDVLVVKGDASSVQILESAQTRNCDLFISVTTNETTNLLAAVLAKSIGARKTIARVSKIEYLHDDLRKNFTQIGVDHLISPTLLAAQEVERLIQRCSVTDIFDFEKGELSIVGFTVDNTSKLVGKQLSKLDKETPNFRIRTICILRNGETIIPESSLTIESGDHLYLITDAQEFDPLNRYIDKNLKQIKNVMIIGDTAMALNTARTLEKDYSVSLIAENEDRCKKYLEILHNTLVINGDVNNIDLLKEEGLERMDAFLALTGNSETNIITSLTAEQIGVYKTIAHVENSAYTDISQKIGVDTLINKKLIAANNIFRYVRKGKVEAIASFHGVDAEIIEFEIGPNSRSVNERVGKLQLPKNASVLAGIIRDDRGIIPDDEFTLLSGDKVIVLTLPQAIKHVERVFG